MPSETHEAASAKPTNPYALTRGFESTELWQLQRFTSETTGIKDEEDVQATAKKIRRSGRSCLKYTLVFLKPLRVCSTLSSS